MADDMTAGTSSSKQGPPHDDAHSGGLVSAAGRKKRGGENLDYDDAHQTVEIANDGKDDKVDVSTLHKNFGLALATAGTKGSMPYSHTYSHAPNPGLQVADLGILGLPLNPREAATLNSKPCCIRASSRTDAAADADVGGLGTWQADSSLVTFQNPAWATWLQKSVNQACESLGADSQVSKPRCELQKLLLDDTDTRTSPQCDDEGDSTTFATLLVILPSSFTGGTTHLSYAHISATYDPSTSSAFGTTVHAWYTGTTYHLAPPTSGARLALQYRLVRTTAAPQPSLAACTAPVRTLHRLAAAWAQSDAAHAPEKLVLLLDGPLRRNSRATTLARTHRLGLGLASVACCLRGQCGLPEEDHRKDESDFNSEYPSDADDKPWRVDMPARWEKLRRRCYEDTPVGEDCMFQEIEEREVVVERFVDLDGGLIAEKLEVAEGEAFPADLTEGLDNLKCDSEVCDGWKYGPLERRYHRTAIVVWPRWSPLVMLADAAAEAGQPPPKRRKVAAGDPHDIIDLT